MAQCPSGATIALHWCAECVHLANLSVQRHGDVLLKRSGLQALCICQVCTVHQQMTDRPSTVALPPFAGDSAAVSDWLELHRW